LSFKKSKRAKLLKIEWMLFMIIGFYFILFSSIKTGTSIWLPPRF